MVGQVEFLDGLGTPLFVADRGDLLADPFDQPVCGHGPRIRFQELIFQRRRPRVEDQYQRRGPLAGAHCRIPVACA